MSYSKSKLNAWQNVSIFFLSNQKSIKKLTAALGKFSILCAHSFVCRIILITLFYCWQYCARRCNVYMAHSLHAHKCGLKKALASHFKTTQRTFSLSMCLEIALNEFVCVYIYRVGQCVTTRPTIKVMTLHSYCLFLLPTCVYAANKIRKLKQNNNKAAANAPNTLVPV